MFHKGLFKRLSRASSKDRRKNNLSIKLLDNLDLQSRKFFPKYLNRNIIISHCRGHDTIILLFDLKYFQDNHRRLLSKDFFCR